MPNQINRDIYVLSSKVKDPIDYVRLTNDIPIVFTFRDYDIPSGATAQIFVSKPSGKSVYNAAEISSNIVTVNVTTQMFSEVGVSALQIQISNSGKNLVTFEYPVRVHKNNTDPNAAESENESSFFKDLQDAANAANEAAESANDAAEEAESKAQAADQAAQSANEASQQIQQNAEAGNYSASVSVGTVTTGDPGTQAQIYNSGTKKDAIFNFIIPQGPQGETGPQGPEGPRGPAGNIDDIEDATVTFSQASSRTNINSGDSIGTLFGKIRKWFADLGTAAFQGVSNVLTQTSSGYVLDARQGKALSDRIGTLSSILTTAKTSLVDAVNELFNKIGDLDDLGTTEKSDVVGAINEINASLSNKEPAQKRGGSGCYRKSGYECILQAADVPAKDIVKTLDAAYRPVGEPATVTGWCKNNNTGGFYPCVGRINTNGKFQYLSALNELGQTTPYYIYSEAAGENVLSRFNVWLTGTWITSVNGT